MDDLFIQRMKARNQARLNVLGLVSEDLSIKQNSNTSNEKTIKSSFSSSGSHSKILPVKSVDLDYSKVIHSGPKEIHKEECQESVNSTITSHTLSSTSLSPKKVSDSDLKASSDFNSSRNQRFQSLAQRAKKMQEWEDDYTYHSVCGGSVKEVESTNMGLHDAFHWQFSKQNYDVPDNAVRCNANNASENECSTPKYYFGEPQMPSKSEKQNINSSKKDNFLNYNTPQSQVDSSFHSANSNFSSQSSPFPVNNHLCTPSNVKNSPSPKSEVVSSSASVTPTRRLAWDKQLLKSLEAQGFTPSPSKSRLAYDFRDRSPIKESVISSGNNKKRELSNSENVENIPPKIVSIHSKVKNQDLNALRTSPNKPNNIKERDVSPSKVHDLRSQWEEHIRKASPDRQFHKSRSPSPCRKFADRGRSPVKSAINNSNQWNTQGPRDVTSVFSKTKENSSSQGFMCGSDTRVSSNSRSFSPHKPPPCGEVIKGENIMPDTTPIVKNPSSSVRERAAAFASLSDKIVPEKDPAELSVQDRLNLFENRRGAALIPKAPFGHCISEKAINLHSTSSKSIMSQRNESKNKPTNGTVETDGSSIENENSCVSSLVGAQKKIFEKFEDNWKETDINAKIKTERSKEMVMLQNRFRRAPPPPPPPTSLHQQISSVKPESSDSEYPESDESHAESDIFVSNSSILPPGPPKPPRAGLYSESPPKEFVPPPLPGSTRSPSKRLNSTELDESYPRSPRKEYVPKIKPGCLFPSLSDIESHSEVADSEDECKDSSFAESILTCASGESLGTKIQRMAQSTGNGLATRQLSVITENVEAKLSSGFESMSSSRIEDLDAIDDAIDEALDENHPASSKRGRITREDDDGHNNVYKTPKICQNSDNVNDASEISLAHSVSMYRKQKPAPIMVTPVRQIVRKSDISSPSKDSPISPSVTISSRIRVLQEEEEHQLTVISQASSAISVVTQHPEQHGTIQHIEAEKLLLVATQKRQCLLNEIQRLKAEGALGKRNYWENDDDSCKGSISISSITLPLKSDFLNKLNEKSIHHFVVLVKHRDQVITSQLQATPNCIVEGAITFPNLMSLHELTADFNISLEVYGFKVDPLTSGIKKDHSRLKLTPLKRLQKESKSYSPAMSSPGGPYSIRSSSFTLIGFANLNINTLTRNAWTLEKVPFSSPVNGHLLMRVAVTMEGGVKERSFLNMFEDIGGFGAWNRRWSVLGGPFIKYWSYPDDETNKESMGKLDLRTCTTRKVELVSRDVCARQHTFQLTFMRPLKAGDKPDLVHEVKNNTLISRILLSADSKEERILWCNKLNKALANIRSWDPDALKPEDFQV